MTTALGNCWDGVSALSRRKCEVATTCRAEVGCPVFGHVIAHKSTICLAADVLLWTTILNIYWSAQKENAIAEAAAAARGKKAARKARRKRRDAALKPATETLPAKATSPNAADDGDASQASPHAAETAAELGLADAQDEQAEATGSLTEGDRSTTAAAAQPATASEQPAVHTLAAAQDSPAAIPCQAQGRTSVSEVQAEKAVPMECDGRQSVDTPASSAFVSMGGR